MKETLKKYACGNCDATNTIQKMLDKAGKVVIPAGRYLITHPLIIHDDTHFVLEEGAYLRLADGANCSLLDNDGLYRRTANHNITIEGGVWDGNNGAQTRELIQNEYLPCDYDKYISNSLTVMMVRLVYTENLTVHNVVFKNPTSYAIHIADAKYFHVENVTLDYDLSKPNMDGVHIQGPARFGRIINIRGDANDDHVALCANGTTRSEVTRDVIEDIDIDRIYCENGYTGVRLLSRGDAVRNITIRNIHGQFRFYAVSFTHYYPLRDDMPILLENIHLSDLYVSKSTGVIPKGHEPAIQNGALIWFESGIHAKNVIVERVFRKEQNPDTVAPTVRISAGADVQGLEISDITQEFVGSMIPPVVDERI